MAIEYTNNAKAAHPRYARPVRDESPPEKPCQQAIIDIDPQNAARDEARPEKPAVSAKTSQGDSSPKDKSMQPRQDVPTRGGGRIGAKARVDCTGTREELSRQDTTTKGLHRRRRAREETARQATGK